MKKVTTFKNQWHFTPGNLLFFLHIHLFQHIIFDYYQSKEEITCLTLLNFSYMIPPERFLKSISEVTGPQNKIIVD